MIMVACCDSCTVFDLLKDKEWIFLSKDIFKLNGCFNTFTPTFCLK